MAAQESAVRSLDNKARQPVPPDTNLVPAVKPISTRSKDKYLAMKGRNLRKMIERTPGAFVYVEASLSARAMCRARKYCLHFETRKEETRLIKDKYRICVYGLKFRRSRDRDAYYHVSCFGSMINQEDLFQSGKFRLRDGKWGLMVRLWHENQGRIDVEKISAYVQANKAQKRGLEKRATSSDFQPGMPPTLGDYTSDASSQDLEHVLKHDDSMEIEALVENH